MPMAIPVIANKTAALKLSDDACTSPSLARQFYDL
jgi:hypothetical protein